MILEIVLQPTPCFITIFNKKKNKKQSLKDYNFETTRIKSYKQ